MKPRERRVVRIWNDKYRRLIMTGSGPLETEPGETVVLIVGRFGPDELAAIELALAGEKQ